MDDGIRIPVLIASMAASTIREGADQAARATRNGKTAVSAPAIPKLHVKRVVNGTRCASCKLAEIFLK